jgi:hypothetical protein
MMEAFVRQAYFVCAISFLFFVATLHFFEEKIVQKRHGRFTILNCITAVVL